MGFRLECGIILPTATNRGKGQRFPGETLFIFVVFIVNIPEI